MRVGQSTFAPDSLTTFAHLSISLRMKAANWSGVPGAGSAAMLLSPSVAVGAELRTKPDRLGFAEEDDAWDVFAAWSVHRHVTVTAAYADLAAKAVIARAGLDRHRPGSDLGGSGGPG